MSGPLDGIRVLDFTLAAVGPFCSRILADMGAEVIRIEWPRMPGSPDITAEKGRFSPEGVKSGAHILFLHCNGGKKSVCVNLKEPAGIELVRKLAANVNVIVENFTPRVMRGYGLDYANLKDANPGLVMCSLTGYGQQGLGGNLSHPCTDPIAQAMGGLSWITGEKDGPPYAIGGGIGDTMTSMAGAIAIVSALFKRHETGVGQYIDCSMVETSLFVDCTAMPYVAANNGGPSIIFRNGQLNTYTFPMGPLKAKEGYISLQAPGPGRQMPWARLCEVMGREDLIDDPRYFSDQDRIQHADELIAIMEGWLQSLPDDATALAILADARISSGPVLSQEQILTHPYFQERGTIGEIDYPELGTIKVVEPPFKFSSMEAFVRGPAPQLGEHNEDVLTHLLGLSGDELAGLYDSGVLLESKAAALRNASGVAEPVPSGR